MTMGVQSNEEESHKLLDYYVEERGGNFIDVAEMYPAPASDPRWMPGASEEIIGRWFAKKPEVRSKVILATKVMGFSPGSDSAGNRKITLGTGGKIGENGKPEPAPARHDKESILEACEASLKRLQTSYIDLYQLHWPDRYAPIFGSLAYDPSKERPGSIPFKEIVSSIKTLIDAGKIKYWGLSNETTYGVCEFVRAADELGCPRPVSIQNQFSLLYRPFEGELAEACAPSHYNIGLLPWTPLGGGMLTDKYIGPDGTLLPEDKFPAEARFTKYTKWMVRMKQGNAKKAVEQYYAIAKEANVPLVTMALQWCLSRWYVTSTIIGATSLEQLKQNLDAFDTSQPPLSSEVLQKIDEVHLSCQNPIQFL
eukprot:GHVU01095534.1.p1 GENE.GHVU01095534.1~~GHVU01095534.1.p1  ORF type:complete len:392 (+),score=61.52 GHVU01095534.1:78-1178(+)